jgi:hypothetical protein
MKIWLTIILIITVFLAKRPQVNAGRKVAIAVKTGEEKGKYNSGNNK